MPVLTVSAIEGVFSREQKAKLIQQLTETMVAIEGENLRPYTFVKIEEVKEGDWGIGGNLLTAAAVKKIAAGKG
jgi:4-oxalocrotonate tautomerase